MDSIIDPAPDDDVITSLTDKLNNPGLKNNSKNATNDPYLFEQDTLR